MAAPVLKHFYARACVNLLFFSAGAGAQGLIAPGDLQLRHDLQLLNDAGIIDTPLTAWPLSQAEIERHVAAVDTSELSRHPRNAFERLQARFSSRTAVAAPRVSFTLAGAIEPVVLRTFEDTPREEGGVGVQLAWQNTRFAVNLAAAVHANPDDDDQFRPDGTYVALLLGNWIVSAGWQDRWFGPGRDGSLILSGNARPAPGFMLQRSTSTPFESRWLRWIGPWTLTSFMSHLDDARTVNDAWLFGVRGSFRPAQGLEIGISRTAQWCGDGRPCDLSTFGDLLVGNDNRGVNVPVPDEPGNQLGGFDIRWVLPGGIPAAAYLQWIGEDGRGGGGAIGSWMRQVGIETWGSIGRAAHRTHLEVSDSMCREGGFGFGTGKPDCAYEHSIYRTGYRYEGRAIGHFADGDGLSYSIGSTLVQSAGHTWNATLRYMEINRRGQPNAGHTLSPSPQERHDFQLSHQRNVRYGQFHIGLGFRYWTDKPAGRSDSDLSAFLRWSSQ